MFFDYSYFLNCFCSGPAKFFWPRLEIWTRIMAILSLSQTSWMFLVQPSDLVRPTLFWSSLTSRLALSISKLSCWANWSFHVVQMWICQSTVISSEVFIVLTMNVIRQSWLNGKRMGDLSPIRNGKFMFYATGKVYPGLNYCIIIYLQFNPANLHTKNFEIVIVRSAKKARLIPHIQVLFFFLSLMH